MKTLNRYCIATASLSLLLSLAPAEAQECQGLTLNTKAVALASPRVGPVVNFSGSGGQLDPAPLLETRINVTGLPGRPVCVTVTFSAQAYAYDNYNVYQASIDDIPMSGHGSLVSLYGYTTPIVYDAVNQGTFIPLDPYRFVNIANSRFLSYTFFASVTPGVHTFRIKLAGCCSLASPGGSGLPFVEAATMVVRW